MTFVPLSSLPDEERREWDQYLTELAFRAYPGLREVVERSVFRVSVALRRKRQAPSPKHYPRRRHGR